MNTFNGIQFLALLIACAVIYRYAIHDKLTKEKDMTTWPENTNPIITVFRENFDTGDKWGSTISFLFALCDIAIAYDVHIPSELQYVPSPFGGDTDADSYKDLEGLMEDGYYIHEPLELEEFKSHVGHALKILGKYDSLLRLNGETY